MFSLLKNQKAQAVMAEYVVIIFIVVGCMTAMTAFVKRALQGRIYDARNYAVQSIKDRTAGKYNGPVYYAYEPYYANTMSLTEIEETMTSKLIKGGASSKIYNSEVNTILENEVAPPKRAD